MEKANQYLEVSYFRPYRTVFEPAQGLQGWTILEKIQTGRKMVEDSYRISRDIQEIKCRISRS